MRVLRLRVLRLRVLRLRVLRLTCAEVRLRVLDSRRTLVAESGPLSQPQEPQESAVVVAGNGGVVVGDGVVAGDRGHDDGARMTAGHSA